MINALSDTLTCIRATDMCFAAFELLIS